MTDASVDDQVGAIRLHRNALCIDHLFVDNFSICIGSPEFPGSVGAILFWWCCQLRWAVHICVRYWDFLDCLGEPCLKKHYYVHKFPENIWFTFFFNPAIFGAVVRNRILTFLWRIDLCKQSWNFEIVKFVNITLFIGMYICTCTLICCKCCGSYKVLLAV